MRRFYRVLLILSLLFTCFALSGCSTIEKIKDTYEDHFGGSPEVPSQPEDPEGPEEPGAPEDPDTPEEPQIPGVKLPAKEYPGTVTLLKNGNYRFFGPQGFDIVFGMVEDPSTHSRVGWQGCTMFFEMVERTEHYSDWAFGEHSARDGCTILLLQAKRFTDNGSELSPAWVYAYEL
jgi:hypothetical protein